MTVTIGPDQIKTALIAGTWPDNTLNEFNIFDYEQLESRRRYPSCEIVFTPESTNDTRQQSEKTVGYEIRYYDKIVGGRSEQLSILKQVEDEITAVIKPLILEDPIILNQTGGWNRNHVQRNRAHPEYNVSILKIFTKSRFEAGQLMDATLTFIKNDSEVKNPPTGDYTYSQVYDTEIYEGYRTVEEQVTINPEVNIPGVPYRFRGGFNSRFITHIHIKSSDIGSTGNNINKFNTLLDNGEKPIFALKYLAPTDDSPTGHTINHPIFVDIERVEYAYQSNDITVFRIFGWTVEPSTMSIA